MFGPELNREGYRDLMHFFGLAGYVPQIGHQSQRMDESLAFVASSGGVALFPRSVSETTADPSVVFRPVTDPTPSVEIVLAWDAENINPMVIELVSIAGALCPW